jgi:hypothetical protein
VAGCPQEWTPDANTAGLWHFNDGLDPTADSSVNGYSGDLVNGPAFVPGAFGSALSFEGVNDYVTMGNQPGLNVGTADFTIEACIKTASASAAMHVVGKGVPHTGPGYSVLVSNGDAHCFARDFDANGAHAPGHEISVIGTAALNDGSWHHLRCQRSGNTLSLYVDGVLIGQGSLAAMGTLDNSAPFLVGVRVDPPGSVGNPQFFEGLIDEARLYHGAPALPIQVDIDIKPGSYPNSVNLGSGGVIPVAILTTPSFDAATVNPFSITVEGGAVRLKGKSGNAGSLKDVDGDGDLDLVVHIVDWTLSAGSTTATLTGQTFGATLIQGSDSVNIVP